MLCHDIAGYWAKQFDAFDADDNGVLDNQELAAAMQCATTDRLCLCV